MRLKVLFILMAGVAWCSACSASTEERGDSSAAKSDSVPEDTVVTPSAGAQVADNTPDGVKALMKAYPDFVSGWDGERILFRDSTTMVYDDGREKTFEQRLDDCDVQDMFVDVYREPETEPEYLADAGRSRSEALFKKMYGSNASAVQRNLVSVDWMGQKVRFTRINGAADSLRKVAAELARYPELRKYMKSSGTFYWRNVRGAKRLSAHSYGIAFDIAVPYSDYWKWRNPKAGETTRIKYANRIPRRIVEIFRSHGFIWGGAWYHYDTMHFEFRPEILEHAKPSNKSE